MLLIEASVAEEPSTLDNLETIVNIVGTSITAVAVVIGAIWAYFKFFKGRTFKPRLEVELDGQWQPNADRHLLRARITLKNIGASKVELVQKGSGLRVSRLSSNRSTSPSPVSWLGPKVFSIFLEHSWIEPGETISDDVLLDLVTPNPQTTLFEARLVCNRSVLGNIIIFSRQVIPADSTAASSRGTTSVSKPIGKKEDEMPGRIPPGQSREDPDETRRWDAEKKSAEERQAKEDKKESEEWEKEKEKSDTEER